MTAREFLKQHGMQITQPRIEVVEDLMEHHVHATAEEIFHRINAVDATVSRASVYNILNTLTEKHAVRAISVDDKLTHYDIDLSPHAHFRCTHCGRIIDIAMPQVGDTVFPEGCKVDTRELYYMGLCPDCAKRAEAEENN